MLGTEKAVLVGVVERGIGLFVGSVVNAFHNELPRLVYRHGEMITEERGLSGSDPKAESVTSWGLSANACSRQLSSFAVCFGIECWHDGNPVRVLEAHC